MAERSVSIVSTRRPGSLHRNVAKQPQISFWRAQPTGLSAAERNLAAIQGCGNVARV